MKNLSYFVKELLSSTIKQKNTKNINYVKMFLNWPEIVGDRLAVFSWPQKLLKNKTDIVKANRSEDLFLNGQSSQAREKNKDNNKAEYILYVEVSNSSFATELRYLENYLIEKIATYFGYKAISQIKIKMNIKYEKFIENNSDINLSKQQELELDNSLNQIDEELRSALKNLGVISKNYNLQFQTK